jgi:four helix bundle protein
MARIESHRELRVWQKAIRLSVVINELTKRLPPDERFGLAEQIRRSARSVHANIAEGQGRETTKDLLHFLAVAKGSLQETDSHLVEAVESKWVSGECARPAFELILEIRRMLQALRAKLKVRKQ